MQIKGESKMSLSAQAIAVLTNVVNNENLQYAAKYADDLSVFNNVTIPNWVATNVQGRNLVSNANFTATTPPTPPAKNVATLDTNTGEITVKGVVDTTIPVPVLPPYVSASGNAFASLSPNLNSQESDLNTTTIQQILSGVNRILKAMNLG
jgi:hypothetical protein